MVMTKKPAVSTLGITAQIHEYFLIVLGSFSNLSFTASKSVVIDGPDFTIASPRNALTLNLEIAKNQEVKFLPIRVGEIFPNLIKYEVKMCLIKTIKRDHLADLVHLKYINLHTNKIELIDEAAFDQLIDLEEINLGLNSIEFLPDGIFKRNKNLLKILLRENQITHISKNTFSHLLKLHDIDLNHNQLTSLKPEIFTNSKNLRKILLMWNKLTTIKVDTFSSMQDLQILDLRYNECYNKRFANTTKISDSFNEVAEKCLT